VDISQLGKTSLTKRGWASEQRGVSQNCDNRPGRRPAKNADSFLQRKVLDRRVQVERICCAGPVWFQ
jgi:hypothetical protein